MLAGEALADVQTMLDDVGFVHADPDTALRLLNRAHQVVALRDNLVRETQPISLVPDVPLYRIAEVFPRFIGLVSADIDGGPMWVQRLDAIRYGDPQWLRTPADDTPQWIYALGLTWVGVYGVPVQEQTMNLTAVVAPVDLLTTSDALLVPDAYLKAVIEVCAGFLMIASEKAYQQGIEMMAPTLGLAAATTQR